MIELLFACIESENANNCSFLWQFEKHTDHLFVSLLDNNFLLKPDDKLITKETTTATAAATSLNKRAETVETFKTRLKTFLFQKHYC